MAVIDNLTLELNADSTKAIKAIDALSQSMASLKVNLPKASAFNGTAKGLQTLRTELSKISTSARSLEKIKALGSIGKGLSKIGENTLSAKRLQGTADGLTAIGSAINGISYEGINKIEKLSSALSKMPKFSVSNSTIKSSVGSPSILENIKSLFSNPKKSGTTEVSSKTGDAQETSESITKIIGLFGTLKTVASKVQPVIAGITTALGVLGKAFNTLTAPLRNFIKGVQHFVKSLARIAFYRFIRSILKSISAGLKEGIQNLALYSKAMEELDTHSANHVMSRYASEFLYFKNAVATAVMPVLRAMIPLIETVINKCIDFINVIAQIGSAFFGTTFTKAKYFWVDYADSLDNANGRAKALHHQLAGFDELNNLTAPSGGSGANDLLDPSKMFEEANISEEILGKINKIKEVLEKVKKLGQDILKILSPIGDKGKEIADWFSRLWERVEPNVKKVWELVEKIWNKLAEPLGEGFVKGFVDEFFNTFSDEDKIEKIGKFSDKIGELADAISKFLDKLDSNKVKKFGELLGALVAIDLKQLPLTLLSLVSPLANLVIKSKEFGNSISNALILASGGTEDFNEKLTALKDNAKEILEGIKKLFIDVKDIVWELGDAINFTIKNFLSIGEVELAMQYFSEKIKKIFKDIKETIGGDLDKIKDKILDLFKDIPILGKIAEYLSAKDNGKIKLQGYATGGYVSQGDLFIANERGAEMVGSIGNQTAVANNDQITQAIATATYNAMSKALSENNGNVTFVVEGDGDQMYKIWQKKNREYERRTGYAY